MKSLIITIAILLTSSCATVSSVDRDYLTSQSVPDSWKVPSRWLVTIRDNRENVLGTMDLEFTDLPISYGACWGPTPESGRIIIHSETIQSNPKYWAAPSYYVRGRYIFADLIAGVCDIRDSLVGELGEFQINGEFLRGGWGNDYHIGNFHAEPVESAEGI